MPRMFRRTIPALFALATLLFCCEPLAAQQSNLQPDAPAVASADAVSPAVAQTAASDAATKDDKKAPSLASDLTSRRASFAGIRVASQTEKPEYRFGHVAPPFMPEAASGTDEPEDAGRQQGGTGQTGGTTGQSGNTNQAAQWTPLTPEQKMRRSLRNAFLSPQPYIVAGVTAAITQAREDRLPHKDFEDEVGDWGSRFARNFANRTTRTILIQGVYASLFKQDPRYDRDKTKSFGGRIAHAASRVFVTRDDDGNLEPNYSRFAGSFTASAIANVWERSTPGHDRVGFDATVKRFYRNLGYDVLSNIVFREVIPTIFGR